MDSDAPKIIEPRTPSTMKHGAFSKLGVLPGEDPREFELHLDRVISSLSPTCPIERLLAEQVARLSWRIQNLHTFDRARVARQNFGELFAKDVPPEDFELRYRMFLLDKSVQIHERLKREKELAPKIREWGDFLLPQTETMLELAAEVTESTVEEIRKESTYAMKLAEAGEAITEEALMKEVELLDRLNRSLNRILQQLMQVKAMKEVIGLQQNKTGRSWPREPKSLPTP